MDTWALDLGTRYFLTDNGTVRTYLAGYVGADRMDALRARVRFAGMPDVASEDFLPQTTRFDAGVEGGVAWQVSDTDGSAACRSARSTSMRGSEETNAFAPVGVEDVRFTDPRWSVPVTSA